MFRSSVLSLAVAVLIPIGCGSASDESLYGPPNPSLWSGASSGGGAASGGSPGTGGLRASGGTAAGGTGAASTGGVSAGGFSPTGGAGGLDPSTGGSSPEIGSPGVIACDGVPCDSNPPPPAPANTCCLGGLTGTDCRPEYVACSSSGASAFHCDDAADCGGGAICCAIISTLITTVCNTVCSTTGSTVQLCRTNGECQEEGRECKPWGKLPEYSICQ